MTDTKDIKKKYSYVGLCYFLFLIMITLFQFLAEYLLKLTGIEVKGWVLYLVRMVPMWGVAFPILYLLLRRIPSDRPGDEKLGVFGLLKFYPMVIFMMIIGSILGIVFSVVIGLITQTKIENSTIKMITEEGILPGIIFSVIVAPVMEELSFRKLLIDRLGKYSKRYTIILSGIMFGLFHRNLYQFFYATILGVVFAYIYTNTGRIHYTMILHAMINLMHGMIPTIFLKHIDVNGFLDTYLKNTSDLYNPEVQKQILEFYTNPYFLMLLLWDFFILSLMIVGIVLFILNVKKVHIDDTASPVTKKDAFSVVYINPGMILFIAGTLISTIQRIIEQILQ